MILVDANVLLYAYNSSFDQHTTARAWLEQAVAGPEPVGLAWLTI
ncbi:MAG: type II toxin-antitoxin system VapC family toxin, partial [Deltaproteobacteria bacterium]